MPDEFPYVLTTAGKRYLSSLIRRDEALTETWSQGSGQSPGLMGEPERDLMVLQVIQMQDDWDIGREIWRPVLRRLFEGGYIDRA